MPAAPSLIANAPTNIYAMANRDRKLYLLESQFYISPIEWESATKQKWKKNDIIEVNDVQRWWLLKLCHRPYITIEYLYARQAKRYTHHKQNIRNVRTIVSINKTKKKCKTICIEHRMQGHCVHCTWSYYVWRLTVYPVYDLYRLWL